MMRLHVLEESGLTNRRETKAILKVKHLATVIQQMWDKSMFVKHLYCISKPKRSYQTIPYKTDGAKKVSKM
jgi:hypothetical protein